MKKIFKLTLSLAFVGFFTNAFAWGTTGHRITAEIAEHHLTPKSKRHLKKIFGDQKLAYYANWPDFIKSDTTGVWKGTDQWHYVNVNSTNNFNEFLGELKSQQGPNLYTQIKTLSSQVKDSKTSQKDREIALRFLIHLIGDMAQPLHVGRAEDLGGNKIQLKFFGENTNLHSLWDSKLLDSQKYSYTEYARVLDVKSKKENETIESGTLEDWLFDSEKQAAHIYYSSPAGSNFSYDYNYKFTPLLERQLLYGGLRLAKVLNDIL